jgi:hypothetical protein
MASPRTNPAAAAQAAYKFTASTSASGSFIAAVETPGAPPLTIRLMGPGVIAISWPSTAAGFVLQQNSDLNTTNWTNADVTPGDDGGHACGQPVVPSGFDQGFAGVAVAGLGDASLSARVGAGVFTGYQAQIAHEVARALEALDAMVAQMHRDARHIQTGCLLSHRRIGCTAEAIV